MTQLPVVSAAEVTFILTRWTPEVPVIRPSVDVRRQRTSEAAAAPKVHKPVRSTVTFSLCGL